MDKKIEVVLCRRQAGQKVGGKVSASSIEGEWLARWCHREILKGVPQREKVNVIQEFFGKETS